MLAVPSHYTRSSTSKKYLPLEHKNISAVYRAYKTECVTASPQRVYVKEKVFREIFTKKFNIRFHLPKKDKCNICEKIKNTPDESLSEVEKEKFEKHKSDAALSKDVHLISQEREVTVNKPKQRRGSNSSVLQPAYKKKLSISIQKYNDLAKLCKDGVIPLKYHREFLEMSGRTYVNDTLEETDEEDGEIDTSESIEV